MRWIGRLSLVCLAAAATPAYADAVIGSGTPASCDEAALNTALAAGGTVTFNCGSDPHTIAVTSRKTIASGAVVIDGGDKITLSGGSTGQLGVMGVASGAELELKNITITGGHNHLSVVDYYGGGVLNYGTLKLTGATITDNKSLSGGGVFNGDAAATVVILESTVSDNDATDHSAGIYNLGTLFVTYSTVSGNQSAGVGGGISSAGTLGVANSTVSGNSATQGGGIYVNGGSASVVQSTVSTNTASVKGGGILTTDGGVNTNVAYSTIANNTAPIGAGLFANTINPDGTIRGDGFGFFSILIDNAGPGTNCVVRAGGLSGGNVNFATDTSCDFFGNPQTTTEVSSAELALGALADNGGPSKTHALGASSVAIDVIAGFEDSENPGQYFHPCSGIGAGDGFDQRGEGFSRPVDGDGDGDAAVQCDAGPIEYRPPNTPPSISDVADQTLDRNSSTGAISFSVEDAETAADDLEVTAASSNQTLAPDANIALALVDGSRTVTVTPAANQSGTAIITLTVSDGALSDSDTFTVTVDATDNAVPTISNIGNKTTKEDTALTVPFTVGDADDGPAGLALLGASSNDALVPDGNIVFGGAGASRNLTITPLANQSGTTTISVTVDDGDGGSATDTFVLTVTAVNDAPTITPISNHTISEDQSTAALSVTIDDVDENDPPAGLKLTRASSNTALVPTSGIVLGGSGTDRTVTVTPAANKSGVTTITVTVSDGSLKASTSFMLTVTNVDDGPPTISDIKDKATKEDDSIKVSFKITDQNDPLGAMNLSAASSNTTLVPVANMVFSGTTATRYLTITPAANQFGVATLTVTATDGDGNTASDSFQLTVTAVNDAPTISPIPDQVGTGGSGFTVNFTVDDVDHDESLLTLTRTTSKASLIPLANVVLGGSGANRSVSITPSAGKSGTAKITVKASDGKLTTSESFTVTVSPDF